MAKLFVLAVHDKAVDAFNRPIFVPARGAGIRAFMDEVARKSPDNPISQHPGDFALYELGWFDEESGRIECLDIPDRLCQATDFVFGDDK